MVRSQTSVGAVQIEVVDEAASVLRERILTGRYQPGDPLVQEHVARELRVGRTPTREALRMLEQEGLVQADSSRGVRVVGRDPRRVIAAHEARGVLEGLAARLAASRNDRGDWLPYLDRTLALQSQLLDESDPWGYAQAAADFHMALAHMSGNRFVISQAGLIRLCLHVLGPVNIRDGDMAQRSIRERKDIRDAIDAGSPDTAEELARTHIEGRIAHLQGKDPAMQVTEREGAPR